MKEPVLTSADRLALLQMIRRHPEFPKLFKEAWRLKRLGDRELQQTAKDLGLAYKGRIEKTREIEARRREVAHLFPPAPTQPVGSFRGVFRFPLTFNLLGYEVTREARLVWGYTPDWDHWAPRGNRLITDARETLEYALDVRVDVDAGVLQLTRDGIFRPSRKSSGWQRVDLLGMGMLPEELHRTWRAQIEVEARRQDDERPQRSEPWIEDWEACIAQRPTLVQD